MYLQNIISFCFWFARFGLSPCRLIWASSRTRSKIFPGLWSLRLLQFCCSQCPS